MRNEGDIQGGRSGEEGVRKGSSMASEGFAEGKRPGSHQGPEQWEEDLLAMNPDLIDLDVTLVDKITAELPINERRPGQQRR